MCDRRPGKVKKPATTSGRGSRENEGGVGVQERERRARDGIELAEKRLQFTNECVSEAQSEAPTQAFVVSLSKRRKHSRLQAFRHVARCVGTIQ